MTASIRLMGAGVLCLRQALALSLWVSCLFGLSQFAIAQTITTRMVVPGGSANTTSIFQGQSVTFEVRLDAPNVSTIGTIYRLTQTSPGVSGYLAIIARSIAGSPFTDLGSSDAEVTEVPGNLLDPDNDVNLGKNVPGLSGVPPGNNILVATITLSSSLSTPPGTYRIQPANGSFATEITTDPLGYDVPMTGAFFDVVVLAVTPPGPPTAVTATAGDTYATVTFTPPANNGGNPIIGYTVTSHPAGGVDTNAGSTSTTHIIGGLTSGTPYNFTVTASNALFTSVASQPSNTVTPVLSPCTYSLTPTDLPSRPHGGGSVNVTVTTPNGCPVSVVSFQPWVSVNSITPNGNNTTTVSLQISGNLGAARSTSIVLAGRLFLITQQ